VGGVNYVLAEFTPRASDSQQLVFVRHLKIPALDFNGASGTGNFEHIKNSAQGKSELLN